MIYADEAAVISRSRNGLARMTTAIENVFGAFGLTISEKKKVTVLMRVPERTPQEREPPEPLSPQPVTEATGQKYAQTTKFRYLGGLAIEHG